MTTATATDNLTLNVVEDKPAGTSISYEVTADGGTTWQPIAPYVNKAFQFLDDYGNATMISDPFQGFYDNLAGLIISSKRLKTLNELEQKYGKDYYSKWSFFKVSNSPYKRWLNDESYDIYAEYNLEHYVFLTTEDIFEVISTYSPDISMKKINSLESYICTSKHYPISKMSIFKD